MKPRLACLIFNPVAGRGDPEADLQIIVERLEPGIKLDICYTQPDKDVSAIAAEAIASGVDLVIAAGGDGTISGVAEALINSEIPLAVIPRGTANAFANALGIPTTIPGACDTILNGVTRVVDAARCNGKPMILLAGVGWEAEAVEQADRGSKSWLGFMAYLLAGLDKLWDLKSFSVEIEIEGQVSRVRAIAVTIANAAPPSSVLAQGQGGVIPDDGLLDVTIISTMTEIAAIQAVSSLMGGALSGMGSQRDDVLYLRTNRLKVIADPPQKVAIDGELNGMTPVEIECLPLGLKVVVPQI